MYPTEAFLICCLCSPAAEWACMPFRVKTSIMLHYTVDKNNKTKCLNDKKVIYTVQLVLSPPAANSLTDPLQINEMQYMSTLLKILYIVTMCIFTCSHSPRVYPVLPDKDFFSPFFCAQ